jgi:chemotaxis protein methyltransferase CheR
VTEIVGAHAGLSFESTRRADAETGIRRAMEQVGVADASRYLELLEAGRVRIDALITELTVGETYFFREPAHFAFIHHDVFPDVRDRRGADHVFRVWSAGCATGEEPYSLAIVLEEARLRGHVLATDISRAALQRAREAAYRPWSLRGLDHVRIDRALRQVGDRWVLDARLGQRVTFQFHNLAQDAYPPLPAGIWGMDLILCRNVLIYFDKASIARVARGLHESLADGGWLITGPSDPPLDTLAPLVPVVTEDGVFYRKDDGGRRVATSMGAIRQESPRAEPVTPDVPLPFTRTEDLLPPSWGEPTSSASDPLARAREALTAGEYERVLALTQDTGDVEAAVLRVRAVANARGSEEAAHDAQRAVTRHPLSTELHLLHALLLLDLKRHADAEQALKRVIYLDRSLAIASHLLGSTLRDQGKLDEARRAYRNARDVARGRPPDEEIPLADGEPASALAAIAEAELALLDTKRRAS